MNLVEIPVKKMQQEIAHLEQVQGRYSEMYARGAIDALKWLQHQGAAPSEGKSFPLLYKQEV